MWFDRIYSEKELDGFHKRVRYLGIFTLGVFFLFLVKLFFLQIIKGPYYREIARKRSLKKISLPAPRGNIFDRRGILLAGNAPSFVLTIDPKENIHKDATLRLLARILGEDFPKLKQEYLLAKRHTRNGPVVLKRDISRDLVARIEARKYYLPGIEIQVEPERYYPMGEKAFHLIGYVARIRPKELRRLRKRGWGPEDFLGQAGLEKQYDSILRGKKGERLVEIDALGRIRKVITETPPSIGKNLILTIDSFLQQLAYKTLGEVSGALVVMDPRDGKLLALTSRPSVNPQFFISGFPFKEWQKISRDPRCPLLNKALSPYPPGSTFKVVTAIAGLEEGVITPSTIVDCPGYYRLGRHLFRCWKWGGHGKVDLIKALAFSCDTYFYYVGEHVGIDKLSFWARECGLGRLTGLGFAEEKAGLVPDREWKLRHYHVPWQKGETLNVAIGQGALTVTPLQLAKLLSAIVNGGYLYKPWCVAKIINSSGEIIKENNKVLEKDLPLRKKFLKYIQKGLIEAVNNKEGTGRGAALEDITIGGKTGTAQVVKLRKKGVKEKIPYSQRDHAWFMAYAPAEHPEIVLVVFIEHGGHGSSAAVPVARAFLQAYFKGVMQ